MNRRCTAFECIRSRIYPFHVDFTWISVTPPIDPPHHHDGRAVRWWKPVLAISTPASRFTVPLITRRQPSTVRPQRPCNVPNFARRGRDTRADRAPRPNRVASRRNVAPRGPERPHPMSRAAHRRWVRSGRFRRDATGCDRARDPRGGRGRPMSAFASRDRRRPPPRDLARPHPPDSSIALPIG